MREQESQKVKAKFIKHKNPRKSLGIDPLERRNFNSRTDFVDWLYNYVVPDFYNMGNNLGLWEHIMDILNMQTPGNLPAKLFRYIEANIIPYIKIKGMTKSETDGFNYTTPLRRKYPFSSNIKDNGYLQIEENKIQESNFMRHKDARKALGINILHKRDFKNLDDFVDWLYQYIVRDFYKVYDKKSLCEKIKHEIIADTFIPMDFYKYVEKELGPEITINGESFEPGVVQWPGALRQKWDAFIHKTCNHR